jgi:multidrug resistance protein
LDDEGSKLSLLKMERSPSSIVKRIPPLLALLLAAFIDMVGFGVVVPVLPLYTERFGASPFAIGMLLAAYSGMGFIFSPVVGALSDRLGRRSILLLSTIGQSTGFLIMGAANTLLWLFVARIIDGIFGANLSTTQAYIADVTPPGERSQAMGQLGAAFGLGFICGPLLGGVFSQVSMSAPFYFAGALAAANAVLIYFVLPESMSREVRSQAGAETLVTLFGEGRAWSIWPLLGSYFFMMTGFSILTSFFAIFTEDRFGYNASQNAYIFAGVGAIGVIIQGGLLGELLRTFGEKRLAMIGITILACSLFMLPLAHTLGALLLVGAGIAVGNGFVNPTISGLVSLAVGKYWQGRVLGLMQSSGGLGRFIGPILGGWLLTFNPRHTLDFGKTPFWVSSAIVTLSLLATTTVSVDKRSWLDRGRAGKSQDSSRR